VRLKEEATGREVALPQAVADRAVAGLQAGVTAATTTKAAATAAATTKAATATEIATRVVVVEVGLAAVAVVVVEEEDVREWDIPLGSSTLDTRLLMGHEVYRVQLGLDESFSA